jgi:hypothetical protein
LNYIINYNYLVKSGLYKMIDPITAITAATAAFNTVKKFVHAGQEFENVAGQLGKWYTAAADFRHAQAESKNPPIFKKLFQAGSVEEEALAILIHEKKLVEQEKELAQLLNMRFGWGTMDELKQMRRKIRAQRQETVYKQIERKKALMDGIVVTILIALCIALIIGGGWLIGIGAGLW